MTWQDPMNDTQQKETRRRIKVVLDALVKELKSRGLSVDRQDENTLIVNGMTFTATDQLSDTYNDVCYLLTDYNQMIDTTLSRISECADTIEEILDVQVEKIRKSVDMPKTFTVSDSEITQYKDRTYILTDTENGEDWTLYTYKSDSSYTIYILYDKDGKYRVHEWDYDVFQPRTRYNDIMDALSDWFLTYEIEFNVPIAKSFNNLVKKQRMKNNAISKSWQDGETIHFDNDDIVVYVRTHPRLGCIDVYMQRLDRHNAKFLGRYEDRTSEWQLRQWLMEDHPELKYDDSELYEDY